jgi:IS30 family transposase
MANGYSHLAVQERALIETQLRLGMSPGAIAGGLLRPRSTVTREIRRNGWQSVREQAASGPSRIAEDTDVWLPTDEPICWRSNRGCRAN